MMEVNVGGISRGFLPPTPFDGNQLRYDTRTETRFETWRWFSPLYYYTRDDWDQRVTRLTPCRVSPSH